MIIFDFEILAINSAILYKREWTYRFSCHFTLVAGAGRPVDLIAKEGVSSGTKFNWVGLLEEGK